MIFVQEIREINKIDSKNKDSSFLTMKSWKLGNQVQTLLQKKKSHVFTL
jgi:hypothetical protein